MSQDQEYIWYASYGSNLLEERFLCYIKGGQPIGSNKKYSGCRDQSLPIDNEEIYINSELYFAKKSPTWNNGGVCFIKTNFDAGITTLGRMYLITKDQFVDVVKQETENVNDLTINFEKVILEGSLIIKEKSWYGNLIYLGESNNHPIFTFTNKENLKDSNKPNENYLKTIIKGLKETYNLNLNELFEYLSAKDGIKDNFTSEELTTIINDVIRNI